MDESKKAQESVFLDDIEREKITHFLNDGILKEAVRKVFLKRILTDGVLRAGKPINPYENLALNIYKDPMTGEMYSDEELGKLTKLRRLAIELVQRGFTDLENFKKVIAVPEKTINRAK